MAPRRAIGPIRTFPKRSIVVKGLHTSVSLEDEFWNLLGSISSLRGVSRSVLVSEIAADLGDKVNLSSALRLYVLEYFKTQLRS